MSYLEYDTEIMKQTQAAYGDACIKMGELKLSMQRMVDSIGEGWQSEAGEAFLEKYSNEWLEGFSQYSEVLYHMMLNLNTASKTYGEVTEKAEKLGIDTFLA